MARAGDLLAAATDRLRASGSETPRLDAELLLTNVLGISRTTLIAHPEAEVGGGVAERFEADVARRAAGEPVAYIRGLKEFHGLAFSVDTRALIPRPETELLVEMAEHEVMARLTAHARPAGTPPLRILDVGTGSGAIPVALAHDLRRRHAGADTAITATEINPDTLQLARENAAAHAVADLITFLQADLAPAGLGRFEVVTANLPYIPSADVPNLAIAASFEPVGALDGGPDGLEIIRRLLALLPELLEPAGVALLEIGAPQGESIVEAVAAILPGWRCRVANDLAGLPRVAQVERA